MADPSLAEAVALPPAEAISFLRQKTNTTSHHWTDLWNEAHSRSFMVAGAASDALVADFRAAVAKAIEQGTTLAEFRRDFDAIVAKHGWVHNGTAAWRSQIIYETNLSVAYAAGRYAQMTEPTTLLAFPYWEYMHTSSLHPRPQHLAWVGTVLAADDAWWSTHYPPNGWRCRCWVRPLTRAGLHRRGKSGPDQAPPVDLRPWRNPHTGVVVQVPHGIDPGWGYNPGAAWLDGSPPSATGGPPPGATPPASGAPEAEAEPEPATRRAAPPPTAPPPARPERARDADKGGSDDAREDSAELGHLGTEFGESRVSRVSAVAFERASTTHPAAVRTLRYDDADGLRARGIDVEPYLDGQAEGEPEPFPGSRFAQPPPAR